MVKKKNKIRPICQISGCRGGLVQSKALDGRPQFICTKCGNDFTMGRDGGDLSAIVPMKKDR